MLIIVMFQRNDNESLYRMNVDVNKITNDDLDEGHTLRREGG